MVRMPLVSAQLTMEVHSLGVASVSGVLVEGMTGKMLEKEDESSMVVVARCGLVQALPGQQQAAR